MNTDLRPAPTVDERFDLRAGDAPIPRWLLAVCVILLAWGGYYLNRYSARFRAEALEGVYHRILAGPPAPVDPVALGRQLFTLRGCIGCHQLDGQGLVGQFPPLVGSEWIHQSPARLSRIVLHGLQGPIQVKGQTFNNVMPGFGPILDDQQAAAVLTFIRQEWGNDAGPVPIEAVTAARAAAMNRTTPWTVEELQAATPDDGPIPSDAEPAKSPPASSPAPEGQ
jgi:mono/diheme cytochrome c family protein